MITCGYDRKKTRSQKALSQLRPAAEEKEDRRPPRRPWCIQTPPILRPNLYGRRHEQGGGHEGCPSLARSQVPQGSVRGMWRDRPPSYPSPGRELEKQQSRQSKNPMPKLSFASSLVEGRALPQKTMGQGNGFGWALGLLRAYRGRSISRGRIRDARAYFQPVGQASYRGIAARPSAGATRLVRMMEIAA